MIKIYAEGNLLPHQELTLGSMVIIEKYVNPFMSANTTLYVILNTFTLIVLACCVYLLNELEKKAPIFKGKGYSHVKYTFYLFLAYAFLDVVFEFVWFNDVLYRIVIKPFKQLLAVIGLLFLLYGVYELDRFTKRLLGKIEKRDALQKQDKS